MFNIFLCSGIAAMSRLYYLLKFLSICLSLYIYLWLALTRAFDYPAFKVSIVVARGLFTSFIFKVARIFLLLLGLCSWFRWTNRLNRFNGPKRIPQGNVLMPSCFIAFRKRAKNVSSFCWVYKTNFCFSKVRLCMKLCNLYSNHFFWFLYTYTYMWLSANNIDFKASWLIFEVKNK